MLGVSKDASDEEIKAAYRRLAKKYHPDLNPGDEEAARRMNEVNAAYEQIKNPQPEPQQSAGGAYGGYSTQGGYADPFADFWGFGGFGGGQGDFGGRRTSAEFQSVEHFIRARQYADALRLLSETPEARRSAEWYYFSAQANFGLGNRMQALDHARRACAMAPDDADYAALCRQIEAGGQPGAGYHPGAAYCTADNSMARLCLGICAAQMFCRFCGYGFYC